MDDAAMGVGLLLFPQMYQQLQRKDDENQNVKAICPHCGAVNEHPYKFCRECGKRPEVPRNSVGNTFRICPYCGVSLDLPKQPVFCPYCTERLQ